MQNTGRDKETKMLESQREGITFLLLKKKLSGMLSKLSTIRQFSLFKESNLVWGVERGVD